MSIAVLYDIILSMTSSYHIINNIIISYYQYHYHIIMTHINIKVNLNVYVLILFNNIEYLYLC